MSTYTNRRIDPQGQHNTVGQRQSGAYTQAQHGVSPGRRADGVNRPFPHKPVGHRRSLNPVTQDSLDLCDFKSVTITKQPRGSSLPRECHLYGTRETTGSRNPRKDLHRLPSGELQMTRAIHAKELMLQEKLRRVEEKIREKIQRDRAEAAAGNNATEGEEERHDRGQAERGRVLQKNRQSEQHGREAARRREMSMQEDVKQLRRKQDQRNEGRMRNTHEEEGARWKRRETEVAECPQSERKRNKEARNVTVNQQKVSGELKKSKWENVKEHTRGKGDDKDPHIWGEAGVRPQDGMNKEKQRKQMKGSVGDPGSTGEKKHRERSRKDMHDSYDERDVPQISQRETAHRPAPEKHTGAERKISREPSLPGPSPSSGPQEEEEEERRLVDSTDASLQLLPCKMCNRKFASERLEKHVQVCEKVRRSHRPVFNSYANRTKGSAVEEFWKTHSRSKTPEVLQKKKQRHKAITQNMQQGRLPAGTSQPKRPK